MTGSPTNRGLLPTGLARRFALAAAGLAAGAVLLVAFGSGYLIDRQREQSVRLMGERERQFHAATIASTLGALTARMSEVASSTILATGLVDSAGRETYLTPFLSGIRQINGVPVQVLFTDFEGKEIASNAEARFSPPQLQWLRLQLQRGSAAATVFDSAAGAELVALEPLRYSRTPTPEGGLLYKVRLRDLRLPNGLALEWGPVRAGAGPAAPVAAPPVFQPLLFRVAGLAPSETLGTGQAKSQLLAVVMIALGIFVVVLVVGGRLAKALTSDLNRLDEFATRVMDTGLSNERATVTGTPEVARLAASINQMLDRLSQQHQALTSEGDKLARLAQELTLADQRKDEFLAMLAHELRNPLAPISSGAALLRRELADNPRVVRTSEIISRQVQHMTQIVYDLLDVSRVTRGLVTVDRVRLDIGQVVSAAVDQVRPYIESRGHHLQLQVALGQLQVVGDQARLVQVVSNLLQNAAKYTPHPGTIRLAVAAEGDTLVLTVQDDGGGIAPELMPVIFELFTQGSRSSDRSQGGLGLGLPLVKNLVELHGGTVSAASPGVGQGSIFTVRLPLAEQGAPAEPAPGAQTPAPAAQPRALRLMLVDDNVDAAQTLAEVLEMDGLRVRLCHEADSALRHAGEGFDVFILDIGLPGMDGMELARRLRAMPQCSGAVLVALTGYGQQSDRERTAEAGFDHHLVKPVDAAQLLDLLAAV